MKLLITGASGYIAQNFITKHTKNYDIITFSLQDSNIDKINFKQINTILHCAALVHQKKKINESIYYKINMEYPVTLAKRAKANGVRHFIFISTIAVYGENVEHLTENTECNPVSFYGKSKLEAEKQLMDLGDESFIVSIIRPPMVYGKDAPGNIASLIQLIQKIPILPFANINNKRSFVYINNLTTMIHIIIKKQMAGIFLAGDDQSLSTTELITLIAKELNKNILLINLPFFKNLLRTLKSSLYKRLYGNLTIDNSQTKKVLEFKNLYTTEQGIYAMIHGEEK